MRRHFGQPQHWMPILDTVEHRKDMMTTSFAEATGRPGFGFALTVSTTSALERTTYQVMTSPPKVWAAKVLQACSCRPFKEFGEPSFGSSHRAMLAFAHQT